MTGGTHRSLEDLLRDRLAEVDAMQPPDPDFEFRALRAGRERLKRRQAWSRVLVGAAAAVVIGAVAIPSLGRLGSVGGGGSTSSAVAGSAAPEATTGGGPAQDLKGEGAPPAATPESAAPSGNDLSPALGMLRPELERTYPSVFTAVETRWTTNAAGVTSPQIVLHLTQDEPGAVAAVRAAFPSGPEVVVEKSAYTLVQCGQQSTAITNDRADLEGRGIMLSTFCDNDGRVRLILSADGSPTAKDYLLGRYGDRVTVQQLSVVP